MPFIISQALIRKLPEADRGTPDEIGNRLISEHSGNCNLCTYPLKPESEELQADHEIPVAEGGSDTIDNLRIVHKDCNTVKKNVSSKVIRPFLKLRRYMRDNGPRLKYDGVVANWDINPKKSYVSSTNDVITLKFFDETEVQSPIYSETLTNGDDVRYTFVRVPRVAIFNDDKVQPRFLRVLHISKIYFDLLSNPLHEPPSCRIYDFEEDGNDQFKKLLMFDGQHKTVATWLTDRHHVVVKLYLNLSEQSANRLINSIQSAVPKLTLSPFELSAKMSTEYQTKSENYIATQNALNQPSTEQGFIQSLNAGPERNRGKKAFQSAVIQDVWDRDELKFKNFIRKPGVDSSRQAGLTEQMMKSKLIEKFVTATPLGIPFAESAVGRSIEAENCELVLNTLYDCFVEPNGEDEPLNEIESERLRRFSYQGSLAWISDLCKELFRNILTLGSDKIIIDVVPSAEKRAKIQMGIENMAAHNVWTAPLDQNTQMQQINTAWLQNQNLSTSFNAVNLTLGYVLAGPQDSSYQQVWEQ